MLVLAGVEVILGIASVVVMDQVNYDYYRYNNYQYDAGYPNPGTGIWGTLFTWPAGILGICAVRNVETQALMTACMAIVSSERQKRSRMVCKCSNRPDD